MTTYRQQYDAKRSRIRIDDRDGRLKDELAHLADNLGTSSSQLAALFVGWGLLLYHRNDAELDEYLGNHVHVSSALAIQNDIEIHTLLDQVANLAEHPNPSGSPLPSEATIHPTIAPTVDPTTGAANWATGTHAEPPGTSYATQGPLTRRTRGKWD